MTRLPERRYPLAVIPIVLLAWTYCFTPGTAWGSSTLRSELGRVSDRVATILASKRQTSIGLGAFDGPATFPASSGPGVAQILKEELAARNIEVRRRAKFGLKGSFALTEVSISSVDAPDKMDEFIAVRVTVVMVDEFDKPVADFFASARKSSSSTSFSLRDDETISQLVGLTGSVDPSDSALARNQQLREQITGDNSAGHLRGTQLFADKDSPYGIEILAENSPRSMSLDEGLAFVPLHRGEMYTVRLVNHSSFDAAAVLTIDGISSFAFCHQRRDDGSPVFKQYLIPAGQTIEIKGWFRDTSSVEAFLVTTFDEGVAAELNQTSDVGTITASFHAAWAANAQRPPGEPDGTRGIGNATGRGERLNQQSREVIREIGVFRSAVSVRYERPSA